MTGLKPGFFDWHDDKCQLEFRYEKVSMTQSIRAYWCETHNQWCYERPTKLTYTWDDGTTSDVALKPKRLKGSHIHDLQAQKGHG